MRVLLATPWLPPRGGGLERYADRIAVELARGGHEVTLLGHAERAMEERVDGVLRVGVVPQARLSNTPLSLDVSRAARRLLRAATHDVVNVHTPVPGTAELVAAAARRAGVASVVTYHAGTLGAPAGLLSVAARAHGVAFQRRMIRRASGRIAVSPYVAAHVFRGLACEVVPPGVDAERFSPRAEAIPGRVLFVGPPSRAYAWKGLSVLANAMERLDVPQARLRIVGDGDLAESYRARGFEVVGRVDDDRLVREYSEASVVVLPSVTPAESFGMCLAEANACGRPVIGSRIGGIPSFVRDGENGLLVPPGDAAALADAIRRILTDAALARTLGETGRERVLKEHRWDTFAERTLRVFERAAGL